MLTNREIVFSLYSFEWKGL